MFFTKQKLAARVAELGGRRYFGHQRIAPFVCMEGELSEDDHYTCVPKEVKGGTFQMNDFFIGRNRYLWLEKEVQLPEPKDGCEVVGLFDFGDTAYGGNSGFESLLYVDEKPYQSVDTNHNEVVFLHEAGKTVKLNFMLWTGMEGGGTPRPFYHRCRQSDVAYLHKKADELYYFGQAIVGSLDWMEEDSEHYQNLIFALDCAMRCIDWDGEDFYASVETAHDVLMTDLSKLKKDTNITINAIGQTHIDVAWLWRLKHTREKAQRSFATVLHLMEQYDEYIFLQSQPQLYKFIKEDCPEIYEKIKQKVKEGKWEAEGGMWVEADCNLSSGESLVRQFLHGTRFFEREFGKKCEYLWLPDVFGYSWALPQILKQCEIQTFMTTKISWNQYNSIPADLFKWRGIDGTEILTYFVETPEVGQHPKERFSTYNGLLTPHAVIGNWKKFKNKELTQDTLLSFGYGDGGGSANREMLEMRRAMNAIPGVPNVKNVKAGDFFRRMHEKVDSTDRYVHTWDGELYLEYHRGTYTTEGYNKRMNRYMEQLLARVEWLSSVAYAFGGVYEKELLHDTWECVLLHQFHDIIPGSSIREVYQDSHVNYEKAKSQAEAAEQSALQTVLEGQEHVYSIYSANSFGGKEVVFVPEKEEGIFINEQGDKLPAQRTPDGYYVEADVKPFGTITITFCPEEENEEQSPFVLCGDQLETPLYTIAWNASGQLNRIYDKQTERELLVEGREGNVLEIYEDKPIANDAWDIDIFHNEKKEKVNIIEKPQLIECGQVRAVVRFCYRYRKSVITQDMIVYVHSRRIDFKTHVDWKEDHKLLKVAFYTDIRTTKATYDIQFGHVERPTHWSNSWDMAKFEVCGHKWADISENNYGISLLNNCKYGHSIKDGVIRLSLLRAPKHPDTHADMEEHDILYALYPHEGIVTEGGTIEEANRLNIPAKVVSGAFKERRQLAKVSSNNILIDAVKLAEDEDCLIVRLHECRGGRTKAVLESEFPVKRIVPCNLLEHDCGQATEGAKITFDMKPFEIKSFKLFL